MNDAPIAKAVSTSAVADDTSSPLCVLWVGDAVLAQRLVARRAPHVHILARDTSGALELINQPNAPGAESPDILVFDLTSPGIEPLQILEAADASGRDLPVLLLTAPGQSDGVPPAGRLALCDRIVKTSEYIHQLLPSLAQARARHDLLTILGQTRESEERLRLILELQPAAVGVTDRQGKILAMNRAGLELVGMRGDGLGRDFTSLVAPEDRDQILSMVARVCANERAELDHALVKSDGTTSRVRTRGVPLRRDDGTAALLAIQPREASESSSEPTAVADLVAERDQLRERLEKATTRQSDRGQLDMQLEAVRAERDAAVLECEAARTEHETIALERDTVRAERDTVVFERDTARAEHETIVLERDTVRAERDTVVLERNTAREDCDALFSELNAARDRAAAMSAAHAQAQAKWDDEIRALHADYQAKFEALIAERELAHRRQQDLNAGHADLAAEREQLATALADAESRAQLLADERDAAVQQAAAIEAAAVSADAFQASEARAEHLFGELALARSSWQQSEQARAAAAETSAATQAKLDDVHRWLATHQNDLTVLRKSLIQHLCDADLQCKALVSATAAWFEPPDSSADQAPSNIENPSNL